MHPISSHPPDGHGPRLSVPPWQPPPPDPDPRATSRYANLSVLCGLLAVVVPIPILPLLAIALGIAGMRSEPGEPPASRAAAITGIVLGIAAAVFWTLMLIFLAPVLSDPDSIPIIVR